MSEIEEVQEQMKANMEALKDQMTSMMEAMMNMRRMMEDKSATIATTCAATEVDPTHPSGINQNKSSIPRHGRLGRRSVGQYGGPHMVQSKNSFPPYGLPPGYTPPDAVHVPNENANHSVLILLEGQQP